MELTDVLTETRLQRIEAKLDRLLGGPPPEVIGIKEVMRLTGARSMASVYRACHALGIKPYLKGKYRRSEVQQAIAKKSLNDRMALNRA